MKLSGIYRDDSQAVYIKGRRLFKKQVGRLRCGKKFIYTYDDAEKQANKRYLEDGLLLRSYLCNRCKGWHLTKQIIKLS